MDRHLVNATTLSAFYSALLGVWASLALRSAKLGFNDAALVVSLTMVAVFFLGLASTMEFPDRRVEAYVIALAASGIYRFWYEAKVQPALADSERLSDAQLWFIPLIMVVWVISLEAESVLRGYLVRGERAS